MALITTVDDAAPDTAEDTDTAGMALRLATLEAEVARNRVELRAQGEEIAVLRRNVEVVRLFGRMLGMVPAPPGLVP